MMMLPGSRLWNLKDQQKLMNLEIQTHSLLSLTLNQTSDVVITIVSSDTGEATVTSTSFYLQRTGTHHKLRPLPELMMTSLMAHKLQPSPFLLMMPTQMILMVLLIRLFLYQRLMMMLPGSRLLKLKGQQVLMNLEPLTSHYCSNAQPDQMS